MVFNIVVNVCLANVVISADSMNYRFLTNQIACNISGIMYNMLINERTGTAFDDSVCCTIT